MGSFPLSGKSIRHDEDNQKRIKYFTVGSNRCGQHRKSDEDALTVAHCEKWKELNEKFGVFPDIPNTLDKFQSDVVVRFWLRWVLHRESEVPPNDLVAPQRLS